MRVSFLTSTGSSTGIQPVAVRGVSASYVSRSLAILSTGSLLYLAACEMISPRTSGTRIGFCGINRNSGFGGTEELDFEREPNGLISQASFTSTDTGQSYESLSFIQCESGLAVRVSGMYGLLDNPNDFSVVELLDRLRNSESLTSLPEIISFSEGLGFEATPQQYFYLPTDSQYRSSGEFCGCNRFFPASTESWPNVPADGIPGREFQYIETGELVERLAQTRVAPLRVGASQ